MKRHLIWIIAGVAAIGVTVPAFAAAQPSGTPDDNGVPGEVRGNCDEAEHAGDPECLVVSVPAKPKVTVPTPSVPTTASTAPANTVPSNTVPDNTATANTVPDNTVANSLPGDISGPCDEAEHANDPRCTGSAPSDDDSSGRHSGGDDDSSGHGGGDDDGSGHGSDDG
ncbi:MAG TPA: hypothetical protein VFV63_06210 [Ilumatobacteraceae bacterium]|nr:hypothetical protein [Ilumatobacteraceae bacterium]